MTLIHNSKVLLLSIILQTLIHGSWNGFSCLSNPCLHGICLDDLNSTYFCYCINGYTGIQCQTNWNECWSSPCLNGGVCIDGIAMFNCSCQPGFVGEICEENYNECQSNPCLNNGTCLDHTNGYNCSCPIGFSGLHCEIDATVCNATNETRCSNGGVCVEGPGEEFFCKCPEGWDGFLCDSEIDECMSAPCQNGGVCIDYIADYSCVCLFGYSGQNCGETMEICEVNSCKNGALCLMVKGHQECYCVPDFHGNLCQFQYDECQLGLRCINGGSCIDGIDNFTCSCPPNLTGIYCECLILADGELDCTYVAPNVTKTETTTTVVTTEIETITTSEIETSRTEPPETTEAGTENTYESTEITNYFTSSFSGVFNTTNTELPTVFTTEISTLSTKEQETTDLTFLQYSTISTEKSTAWTETEMTDEMTSTIFFTEQPITSSESSEETTVSSIPLDCSQNNCQNGGTCTFLETEHECICPFDAKGKFCETQLEIQKAAFVGDSYLIHKFYISNYTNLEFGAQTLAKQGLLFYLDLDFAYMALYMDEGYLKFQFSCGYQTMLLSELKVPINNGFLMRVKAGLEFSKNMTHCDAKINLNDSLVMSGDQIALKNSFSKKIAVLYLGRVSSQTVELNLPETGFIGCLFQLKILGQEVSIFKDATNGFKISECHSLACLLNPCLNGAICTSLSNYEWKCSCKNGYLGKRCEISICENNPCFYGGTCIPFSGSGYICLCPYGKHGHFCENDLKITKPYFSSTLQGLSSYLAYPIPKGISRNMELKFTFRPSTIDQISLLLFIGQKGNHHSYSDHLSVSFVKGYIMLTWNLGSGPRRIFTSQPIKSIKDYTVNIGYLGKRAWLYVENLGNVTGRTPGNLAELDVFPALYLGGHVSLNFSELPHDLPLHTGFSGCIFGLELIFGNIVLPLHGSKGTIGRAIGECGTTECYIQSCQHGGACLHHASTFMCLCPDFWYGPFCSLKYNPCDIAHNNCSSGSTCVPAIAGYECDCPLGKTGKYCENDEDMSDVSFTGKRSFISLRPLKLDTMHFHVDVEVRSLNDNGLIWFTENSKVTFICLYLQSGLLELSILLGKDSRMGTSNLLTISSTKILNKGIWYSVKFGIWGHKVYLSVDNSINTGLLTNNDATTPLKSVIFLGGIPDMSFLPPTSHINSAVPFKGCIRQFSLDSTQIPLINTNIFESRNIIDCDGTPCGKDICQNGGTCWLDSFLKAHCSCIHPFSGNSCEINDCNEKTCGNMGKCYNSKCSCLNGWNGKFCENPLIVENPAFNGDGYLIVQKSKKRGINTEINDLQLNFTTPKKNGVLLWSRSDVNFIGIGVENGFLKVAYSINGSFLDIRLNPHINDGLWHYIQITFQPFTIKLDLNKSKYDYKDNVDINILNNELFYIGGIPTNESSLFNATKGLFSHAFEGCIASFSTNSLNIIRDFTKFNGINVGTCNIYP